LILPAILILLVLATGYGGGNEVLIIALVLTASPFLARVTRAATLEVVGRGYVEAAVARGERTSWILFREVLPNISSVVLAYGGLLFVGAVYMTAAASFLGIAGQPPAPDWGRMIQENRPGVELSPWGVAAPALLLVLLAVTVNLFADGLQRRFASGSVMRGGERE
jgi:peptide/nickel transport system permease protein